MLPQEFSTFSTGLSTTQAVKKAGKSRVFQKLYKKFHSSSQNCGIFIGLQNNLSKEQTGGKDAFILVFTGPMDVHLEGAVSEKIPVDV